MDGTGSMGKGRPCGCPGGGENANQGVVSGPRDLTPCLLRSCFLPPGGALASLLGLGTAKQLDELILSALVDQADATLGRKHLLKRSLLLIKVRSARTLRRLAREP